ncbi:hypothetical protein JCM15831A_08650 [Asaia astilbis]
MDGSRIIGLLDKAKEFGIAHVVALSLPVTIPERDVRSGASEEAVLQFHPA